MNWNKFKNLIVENLSDDFLSDEWIHKKRVEQNTHPTFGHCYVASEAAYYMLGGKEEGWKPHFINHLGCSHWFLKNQNGFVLDLTASQFKTPVDYERARGKGFLTKEPSKRARILLKKIGKTWLSFLKNC